MQGYHDIEPMEDSTEYIQDLNGHNQEVLWERVKEASQVSDAQIEFEAEMQTSLELNIPLLFNR